MTNTSPLRDRANRLLEVLPSLVPDVTNAGLCDALGISERLVRLALAELEEKGHISVERVKSSPANPAGRNIVVLLLEGGVSA